MARKVKTGDGVQVDFDSRTVAGADRWVNFAQDTSGVPVFSPTITVSASPDYAEGDTVGGILTLAGVMLENTRPARLTSLLVKDKSGQAPALTLLFFRATPAGGTYTDNAAFAWGTNDRANLIDSVEVLSAQYRVLAGFAWCGLGGFDLHHDAALKDIFVVPVIGPGGSWNAASTSDLSIDFHYERR